MAANTPESDSIPSLPPAAEVLDGMALIRGAGIPALVIGKRLGGGPVSYYYDFHPDGRYVQFQDLGIVRRGRWVITQDALCTVLPGRGDREAQVRCRRFYVAPGEQVFVVDQDGRSGPRPLVIRGDIPASH